MGGKQKQAQRVKGNAKPSSSARAAELLESATGGSTVGFVGFGALSGDLGYVPVSPPGDDELDCSVNSNFRMVLRKLSKKDTTTKWKALQDFGVLCKEQSVEDLKSVLPYWPRLYCKVAIDADRRVREAGQLAHAALVSGVGRALQPHLRALSGAWLLAQCDVHAPAASAAREAFRRVFPTPERQARATVACAADILQYIQDMLFTQTAQNFGDPKTCDKDELEMRYEKIVTSSLLSLRLFMLITSSETSEGDGSGVARKWQEEYRSILGQPKFWKMAKHKSLMVQGAFYSVVAAFCRVEKSLSNEFSDKICPLVLHNLDKTEPVVCAALWEAVLYTVANIQDVWEKVSLRKAVFPKLWALFRCAADGNASVIFPSLLPLLSSLPADAVGEGIAFYAEFFGNMRTALSQDKVRSSPSEGAAIVRSFVECLRYCITKLLELDNQPVVEYLMLEQLMPLLETSIADDSAALASTPLYALFVGAVAGWRDVPAGGALWRRFADVCVETVVADGVGAAQAQRVTSLLLAFAGIGGGTRTEKRARVSFEPVKGGSSETGGVEAGAGGVEAEKAVDGRVTAVVCSVCRASYRRARHADSSPHLALLVQLCATYMGAPLMRALLAEQRSDGDDGEDGDDDTLTARFVGLILLPWLRQLGDRSAPTAADRLADLCFAVFRRMSSATEKESFLVDVLQASGECATLVAVVTRARREASDAAVAAWQRGRPYGERVVSVTRQLCEASLAGSGGGDSGLDAHWALFRIALATHDGEPVLGPAYVDAILAVIRDALPPATALRRSDAARLDRCVSFVCDVSQIFFRNVQGCMVMRSAEELLMMIFQLGCQQGLALSGRLQRKVEATWQAGVGALSPQPPPAGPSSHQPPPSGPSSPLASQPPPAGPSSPLLASQPPHLACQRGFLRDAIRYLRAQVTADDIQLQRLVSLSVVTVSLGDHMLSCLVPPSTVDQFYESLTIPLSQQALADWHCGPVASGSLPLGELPDGCRTDVDVDGVPACLAGITFTSLLRVATRTSVVATEQDDASSTDSGRQTDLGTDQKVVPPDANRPSKSEAASSVAVTDSNSTDGGRPTDLGTGQKVAPPGVYRPSKSEAASDAGDAVTESAAVPAKLAGASLAGGGGGAGPSLGGDRSGVTRARRRALDRELLLDVACGVAYCRAVLSTRRAMLSSCQLAHYTETLEASLKTLMAELAPHSLTELLQAAIDRSLVSGQLWSLCLKVVLEYVWSVVLTSRPDPLSMAGSIDRFSELNEPSLHTLQAILPSLSQPDVHQVAVLSSVQLVTCPAEMRFLVSGGLGHLCLLHQALHLLDGPTDAAIFDFSALLGVASELHELGCSVRQRAWPTISFCIHMMQLMRRLVEKMADSLSDKNWDAILCATVSAIHTCQESAADLRDDDLASQSYAVAAFALLAAVSESMRRIAKLLPPAAGGATDTAAGASGGGGGGVVPPDLLAEWAEFFSDGAYASLLPTFVAIAGDLRSPLSAPADLVLRALCRAVAACPPACLRAHALPTRLAPGDDASALPERLQTLLNQFCPLLLGSHRAVQLAAFAALNSVITELPAFEESVERNEEEEEKFRLPSALLAVLDASCRRVELCLDSVEFGDTADVGGDGDASTRRHHEAAVIAYLNCWSLLLRYFSEATSQLRSVLARALVERHAVDTLLHVLFRLLPQNPVFPLRDRLAVAPLASPGRLASTASMFDDEPKFDIDGDAAGAAVEGELQHVACSVYRCALRVLPAVLRQWWNNQDKRTAAIVDRFTSRYVSPLLCAQEMSTVHQKNMAALSNMTVKTRSVTREVIASYTVEEVTMELIVTLAVNHPLGPITVECSRRVGVTNNQWRNWMMQLTTFLSHQNGSILDGLMLWRRNVDKRFEGVEDCMVCFSVIHATNYQLPRLLCRTCKKKFHSACLYKWFSTSNKSTCPLCRNLF